jgi:hypothetical protein
MPAPLEAQMFPGNGYRIANDVLTEMSYVLVEPVVATTLGTAVTAGAQTVTPPTMASIFAGAQLLVDSGVNQEVITVTSITTTTFTATFANSHSGAATLAGATFPVGQTEAFPGAVNNPFFTQTEVLQYISDVQNDYLTACPLILNITTQNFIANQRVGNIPSDGVQIECISVGGVALQEQGQTSLDWLTPFWPTAGAAEPKTWFEDRVNFMTYGVQPVPGNAFTAQLLYAQRDSQLLALNEGFLLPDPFLHYIRYGALMQCFGKDGEMRDSAKAQYCEQRYQLGIQIGRKFYENAQAQETVTTG